jgi:ppGpp synthetase/RelA/SpoT-type nucleotidyltranferase
MTKRQIKELGERLKQGKPSEDDLQLLEDFRGSFFDAYSFVLRTIQHELLVTPTGRAKSTSSIVEKLRREETNLEKMQDIVGCRITVHDLLEQDETVDSLKQLFPTAATKDRREKPRNGYRAVHVIAKVDG